MARQRMPDPADTWDIAADGDALWVWREIPPGWRLEHRIMLEGVTPVIAESCIRWPNDKEPPTGGVGSDVLRRMTVRGVREAAANWLAAGGVRGLDLRALESTSSARRHGDARRWSLAVTSLAYVKAVEAGSRRPNVDAARTLGLTAITVRDRLHSARQVDPPFVTGGGSVGVVGRPELTDAAYRALDEGIRRIVTALGLPPSVELVAFWYPTVAEFAAVFSALRDAAEKRVPGLWGMTLDDVYAAASASSQGIELPRGVRFDPTPHGLRIVATGTES